VDFVYSKITIESPQIDDEGNIVKKNKKPVVDTSKRDTENVPLDEDIDSYFEREVLPYNPSAWVDKNKIKVGYEIPFTRYFYKYEAPENADDISARIIEIEKDLMKSLHQLFAKDGESVE
jgi:type I restriction enzyme M protein